MDDLRRLLAMEAIRQLKARYFRLLDTRDFAGMAGLFCADAVFDCGDGPRVRRADGGWVGERGPVVRGRAAIVAWIAAAFAERTSTHVGHGHEITIEDADTASGIVAMADFIRDRDRRVRLVEATGHYHERYRIEVGEWRIAETRLTRLFRDVLDGDVAGPR